VIHSAHFCDKGSDHIFSYDQQGVSDISQFCERQSRHILSMYHQQGVSDIAHFCQWQFHCTFSYDHQVVSDKLHILVKGSLITSPYHQKLVSGIAHCQCKRQSDQIFSYYDQQGVSDIAHL